MSVCHISLTCYSNVVQGDLPRLLFHQEQYVMLGCWPSVRHCEARDCMQGSICSLAGALFQGLAWKATGTSWSNASTRILLLDIYIYISEHSVFPSLHILACSQLGVVCWPVRLRCGYYRNPPRSHFAACRTRKYCFCLRSPRRRQFHLSRVIPSGSARHGTYIGGRPTASCCGHGSSRFTGGRTDAN